MKKLILICLFFLASVSQATSLKVFLSLQLESDHLVDGSNIPNTYVHAKKYNWKPVKGKNGSWDTMIHIETVHVSKLPYTKAFDQGYFEISKTGKVSWYYAGGDLDTVAGAVTYLPTMKRKIIKLDHPLVLEARGAENATQSFEMKAKAVVHVVP